nr:hypothetical protein [Tanacetum cinerariifolium]
AKDGSLGIIPFKASALNVEINFKVVLTTFRPKTVSASPGFSSGRKKAEQTDDSSVKSYSVSDESITSSGGLVYLESPTIEVEIKAVDSEVAETRVFSMLPLTSCHEDIGTIFYDVFKLGFNTNDVNDVTRLQTLVDKKRVIITEATIRDALRLDDAEGVECLPNEEILAKLARMGYEKPSTKLTFYKAFFSRDFMFKSTKRLKGSRTKPNTNFQCYNCSEKGHYARNCPKPRVWYSSFIIEQVLLAKKDEAGVILLREKNDFLLVDVAEMEELEELSANIRMMPNIQPANIDSDEGPRYDSTFISKVQTPSISYMNLLFTDNIHEQTYYEQPKIINSIIGDDQINSDIIFDDLNMEVNSGSFEHDKNVHNSYKLKQLARSAYKEAEKQQIISNKFKQQNVELNKHLEQYKERVWVFDTNKATKINFQIEFIEADSKAKRLETELQNQFI